MKQTTACGINGWGEVSVGPTATQAVICDVLERHMEGHRPEAVELTFPPASRSAPT
ncbi:hypothetical protein [Pseudooceanicola sp. HF7]|uniref:hypothetical protein n=1 Tax=Pseudooceanicola sp. HF7 TaxID=2721560 RepID=UPI0034C64089